MTSDIYTLSLAGVLTFLSLTGFAGKGNIAFTAIPGPYRLLASHSQKCLDVPEWSLNDGIPVVQWTCNGGENQTWRLETAVRRLLSAYRTAQRQMSGSERRIIGGSR